MKPTAGPSFTPVPHATASGGSDLRLDRTCARRGVDNLTLTAKTKAKGPVGFNTQYSDGSSSVDGHSHYSSGYGGGFADDAGSFTSTWLVPDNAPTGIAVVRVVTQDGGVDLSYRVAAQDGSCP